MLSEQLRAARRRLGISQEELARRLGTTLNTVYRWEAGKAVPRGLYAKAVQALIEEVRALEDREGKAAA